MTSRCATLIVVTTLLCGLILSCDSACQAATFIMPRPGDEIVEVNVRRAGCSTDPVRLTQSTTVSLYLPGSGQSSWQPSDFDSFRSGGADKTRTIVWVHGNRVDTYDARRRALCVYRTLTRYASADEGPIRFVLFSWPSSEVPGLLRDFRVKAARTRPVSWELAWILNQLPAEESVSFIGYSYGARITCGALHLLAGGDLGCGLRIDGLGEIDRPNSPVVLLAAASHAHWLGPNQFHGLAMTQVDQMLMTTNSNDPAMKYYKLVDQNSNAPAMGLRGPTCLPAHDRARVQLCNVSRAVGRTHDLYRYVAVSSFMSRAWSTLMPQQTQVVVEEEQAASESPIPAATIAQ